jgi:very-short-patch-repair endonuclease
MLQRKTERSAQPPARQLWSHIRSKWPDSLVLSGLTIATIGIGYGHPRVIAGGLSVTVGAAWVSIQRQQQATVRDVNLLKQLRPHIEESQQELRTSLNQLQEQIRGNLLPAANAQLQDSLKNEISEFRQDISNHLQTIQQTQQAIRQKLFPDPCEDSISKIIEICQQFHDLAGYQLNIQNFTEKDVQNALEELLRQELRNHQLGKPDIRREYPVPQTYSHEYRIDFLLVDHRCAIEVKQTRTKFQKEIVEDLAIDFEVYRNTSHRFHTLICFIYDPQRKLSNPAGLINDLSGDRGGFQVRTVISPYGATN